MKKILSILSIFFLSMMIWACSPTYESKLDLTMDPSKWEEIDLFPGTVFSYPPEFTYTFNSREIHFQLEQSLIDETLAKNEGDPLIKFKIQDGLFNITYTPLKKCKPELETECNPNDPEDANMHIEATPEEVLERELAIYGNINNHNEHAFSEEGKIPVGNLEGLKFRSQLGKGSDTPDHVVFKTKKGIFTIAMDEDVLGTDFLKTFLKTFKFNTDNEKDTVLSMDLKQWKKESSLSGLNFSYPPELHFIDGGQTGYEKVFQGGWYRSYIAKKINDPPYFTFLNFFLRKCGPDPQCYTTDTVPATVDETFDHYFKSYQEKTQEYDYSGKVKLGKAEGEKFTYIGESTAEDSQNLILFKSKSGVFALKITNVLDSNLLESFLSTFEIE